MNVKVNTEHLSDELVGQLQDWANGELRRQVNEAVKETAETGAKMMKKGGPYKDRSGDYTKSWDIKLRKKSYTAITNTEEYSVYNKEKWRLTHLLENGHQARDGGRVDPFEHIRPVDEFLETLIVSNITKRIGRS